MTEKKDWKHQPPGSHMRPIGQDKDFWEEDGKSSTKVEPVQPSMQPYGVDKPFWEQTAAKTKDTAKKVSTGTLWAIIVIGGIIALWL